MWLAAKLKPSQMGQNKLSLCHFLSLSEYGTSAFWFHQSLLEKDDFLGNHLNISIKLIY